MKTLAILFLSVTLLKSAAFAYLEVDETGATLQPGQYRVGISPQFRTSNGGGGNVTARLDGSLNDSWTYRGLVGGGETNFYAGASFKWIPIPDFESQPALGARFEGYLGRTDDNSLSAFRITPLVSKTFEVQYGKVTPYAAIPLGILAHGGTSDSISQFAVGAENRFDEIANCAFGAELGFNLSKTFSYIAFSATYEFSDDDSQNRRSTSTRKSD